MISPQLLAEVRRIEVRTNRLVTDVMAGGYLSVFRGAGIEFDEVREFAEGDDPRAVDWNVTARTGRPHVKKYVEERELTVLFLLDVSASTRFGTPAPDGRRRLVRETMAQFCACLALAAARNNDKAGSIAFSDRIERWVPPKKGPRHVLRLIREALAVTPAGTGTAIAAALEHAGRVQRKRAVVFVVSDFLVAEPERSFGRALRILARRHDVIAVQVTDPATATAPAAGLLHVVDPEHGQARWLDFRSRRVRAAHDAAIAAHRRALDECLRRAGVDRIQLALGAGESVGDPIVRFFRMRERRGARG
jgi:uncharacterized protein (DUF58 family)